MDIYRRHPAIPDFLISLIGIVGSGSACIGSWCKIHMDWTLKSVFI